MEIEDLIGSALPPQDIHLVGYSLGGRLALRYAMRHPARIHSLTLLSTHSGLNSETEKQNRLQADRIWAQKILVLPFPEFLKTWYDQPLFTSLRQNPELMKKLISMRQNQRPKDLVEAMLNWSLGRQECHQGRLKQFPKPWRLLYGEHDRKYAELYGGLPNAHPIAKAGHALHIEAPQEVASFL